MGAPSGQFPMLKETDFVPGVARPEISGMGCQLWGRPVKLTAPEVVPHALLAEPGPSR